MNEEINYILESLRFKTSIYRDAKKRNLTFNDDEYYSNILIEYIEQLQQENQQLKDRNKLLEKHYKQGEKNLGTQIDITLKYEKVLDEIREYINNYDVFKEFSFPLMKRDEENQVKSSIDYEFQTSIKKSLLQILDKAGKE